MTRADRPAAAPSAYSAGARLLHWATAAFLVAAVVLGFVMTAASSDTPALLAEKLRLYSWHKTIGVGILLLGLLRLARTLGLPRPPPLASHAPAEIAAARAVQTFFIVALVAVPVTGLLGHLTTPGGAPIWLWPIADDAPLADLERLQAVVKNIHLAFAFGLPAALALHVAGALKHHFIDRDQTLRRMTTGSGGGDGAAAGTNGAAGKWGVLCGLAGAAGLAATAALLATPSVTPTVNEPAAEARAPAPAADTDADGPPRWTVDYANSALEIEANQSGEPLSAAFRSFRADIALDPDAPETGRIEVEIDIASFDSGNGERDTSAQSETWFAAAQFPTARFQSAAIERLPDGRYRADGTLSLKGAERPVAIDFALTVADDLADAEGEATIDRSQFQVGIGDWSSDSFIRHPIKVRIRIQATRNG